MKVSKMQLIQNVFEYSNVFKIHSKIRTELSRVVKEVRVKAKKCQNSEGLKYSQITFGKEKCNRIQPRIENEIPNRVI